MTNPNLTDMTEEDAADLQFPKGMFFLFKLILLYPLNTNKQASCVPNLTFMLFADNLTYKSSKSSNQTNFTFLTHRQRKKEFIYDIFLTFARLKTICSDCLI